MTITNEQAMREKFEAWAAANFMLLTPWGNGYMDVQTNSAWCGFVAALEAAEAVRDSEMPDSFADYVTREMPPGTVISSPLWWAPRLWRAAQSAAPSSAEQPATDDDPHEFGAGIVQSPGARYWQKRSAEWMARAVALGWREHRDACQEAGVNPDNFAATAPSAPAADERARFEAECRAKHPHLNLVRRDGRSGDTTYVNCYVQSAYELWQARAQTSASQNHRDDSLGMVAPVNAQPSADDAPRPVATIHECRDAGGCMCDWFSGDDAAAIGRLPVGTKLYAGAPPADARDGVAETRTTICGQCSETVPTPAEPHHYCTACCRADSERLDYVASEYLTLLPIKAGMAIGWQLLNHDASAIVAEVHIDDPRSCIDEVARPQSAWPECSGDPACCPENEGYGCCTDRAMGGE